MFGTKPQDTGHELNVNETSENVLDVLWTFMYVQFIPCVLGGLLSQTIVLVFLYRNIHFSVRTSEERSQFFSWVENDLKLSI